MKSIYVFNEGKSILPDLILYKTAQDHFFFGPCGLPSTPGQFGAPAGGGGQDPRKPGSTSLAVTMKKKPLRLARIVLETRPNELSNSLKVP